MFMCVGFVYETASLMISDALHTMYGHSAAITCFQFDVDKCVSGSEGSIKLWDLRTGTFVRDLVSNMSGAWKIQLDDRRVVCAVQRNNQTWFEVLDFGADLTSSL